MKEINANFLFQKEVNNNKVHVTCYKKTGCWVVVRMFWSGLEIPSDQSEWAEWGDELDHCPGESGDGVR